MTLLEPLTFPAAASAEDDSTKRHQILEGARTVFLTKGFDAASMGEIARAANVSKGTLYVYFKSKEDLFEAIVEQECKSQAEGVFRFDPNDHDVAAVLMRLGAAYIKFLCRPGGASSIRTVIAIAERMPEIGKRFYEAGPAKGIGQLAAYFETQVAAGVLAIDDCAVAASQFKEMCHADLFRPVLFNAGPPPSEERITYVVGIAVRTFLAAYKAR